MLNDETSLYTMSSYDANNQDSTPMLKTNHYSNIPPCNKSKLCTKQACTPNSVPLCIYSLCPSNVESTVLSYSCNSAFYKSSDNSSTKTSRNHITQPSHISNLNCSNFKNLHTDNDTFSSFSEIYTSSSYKDSSTNSADSNEVYTTVENYFSTVNTISKSCESKHKKSKKLKNLVELFEPFINSCSPHDLDIMKENSSITEYKNIDHLGKEGTTDSNLELRTSRFTHSKEEMCSLDIKLENVFQKPADFITSPDTYELPLKTRKLYESHKLNRPHKKHDVVEALIDTT